MERREKRALAFLLAASLLCLALVGLAAGDPPAERAEALFQALERSTRRTEGPGEGAREVPDHAAGALGEAEAGPDLVV